MLVTFLSEGTLLEAGSEKALSVISRKKSADFSI
jgi:hypothetical protein